MSKDIKEILRKDIQYARNSMNKELLYQVHGELLTAAVLGDITTSEFMEMDHMVVYEGINNRDFIKVWSEQYWHNGKKITTGLQELEDGVLDKYRNSITRKAFTEFCKQVKILLGIHVPALPSESVYADSDSVKEDSICLR